MERRAREDARRRYHSSPRRYMMPQPMTTTTTACIEKGTYEPADMMEGAEGCQINDSSVSGNTLSFDMTCSVQGSETSVKGSFFSDGDEGKGNMQMSMKMGEMAMEVSTEWTSRYVGPCK